MPPKARGNNFDLLRVMLAVLVVRCHAALVGLEIPYTGKEYFLGGRFLVESFFVISGYLIFRSWDMRPSFVDYTNRRVRRIVPAYVFVITACTIGLSLVSTLSIRDYFQSSGTYAYFLSHLAFLGFLQTGLPGVFSDNVENYVNGPLWTIKIEVWFYISVPIIAFLATKLPRLPLLIAIYVLSIAWKMGFELAALETGREGFDTLAKQLPGQMSFFVAAAMIHYYAEPFKRYATPLFVTSIVLLAIHFSWGLTAFYPAALAVAVLYLAICLPCLGNAGKWGDFSYGIYIYHYPILQLFAELDPSHAHPLADFLGACAVTIVVAFLSWHLIEKRFLPKSSHYIQASQPALSESSSQQNLPAEPTAAANQ